MALHNYFVTIAQRFKGIFQAENAAEALDQYARSQLYSSWEGREVCTERKDDFSVWRIDDSVQIGKRDSDAAGKLWIQLYNLEKISGESLFNVVYERFLGELYSYDEA